MIDNTNTQDVATVQQQRQYFVVKANELIQRSRFTMTAQQSKILLYLISKIKPLDTGTEVYSLSIGEFCRVCGIAYDSGKAYSDAKRALKNIADMSVWVTTFDGDEVLIRWLNRAKLNHKTNCFEVTFGVDALPYLFDLKTRYTKYSLDNVLLMKSKYGIRLYELLKSYEFQRLPVTFTLDELRARLGVEQQTYTRYPDFRRFVLEKALSDINEVSDMTADVLPVYSAHGQSISGITFIIGKPSPLDSALRHKRKDKLLAGK